MSRVLLTVLWGTAIAAYAAGFRVFGRKPAAGWVDARGREESLRYTF